MKSKKTIILSLFLVMIMLGTSCNQDFKDCVDEWTECKENCPEVDAEAWQECLSGCSDLLPDDRTDKDAMEAFNNCLRACGNPYTERQNCLDTCDEGLRSCLGVEEE
ncbi:hypothetical protein [Ekhidna sp.]|uniref:hypothetical protein n=1 Tax=Ekhidna sp. TaxID=2608089 RepID=UPI003BAB0A80